MNSFIIISGAYPSSSTSAYIVLHTRSEGVVPHPVAFESTSTMTIFPTESTTYEVLTILEPALLSDGDDAGAEAFFRFLDELEAGAYIADDVTTG